MITCLREILNFVSLYQYYSEFFSLRYFKDLCNLTRRNYTNSLIKNKYISCGHSPGILTNFQFLCSSCEKQ